MDYFLKAQGTVFMSLNILYYKGIFLCLYSEIISIYDTPILLGKDSWKEEKVVSPQFSA